ncbi:unnamed protein product, partial [Allacma fusca]
PSDWGGTRCSTKCIHGPCVLNMECCPWNCSVEEGSRDLILKGYEIVSYNSPELITNKGRV